MGISKFKHIYEAELQLSTRFPFHCQDRFLRLFKRGSENEVKKVSKKLFQRVPKWTAKVDQNRQKVCSGGVPKRDLKKVPSPGPGKVRSACYLPHFSKAGGLRKGSFLGTILDPCWHHFRPKTCFKNVPKIRCNIVSQKTTCWHRFGDGLEVGFGQKAINFQDVSQASISNIILERFCYFFDTPQPKKPLFSCRKTRISAKMAFHTSH